MKVLLLSAGYGRRLRPLTKAIPKCLIPVNGKPLLQYWLDLLTHDENIDSIIINTHYLSENVDLFLKTAKHSLTIHVTHENMLLGTGGTILNARVLFGRQSFLVIHADNLSRFEISELFASHYKRPRECSITMMLFHTDQPTECGIVELNRNGVVIGFHEKVLNPPGNLANGAVYIIEPEVLDFLEGLDKKIIDFSTEVLPSFIGRINTFLNKDYHRDIGTLSSLRKAEREFREYNAKFNG